MVTLKPYVWILAMGKGALRGRVQKPLINTAASARCRETPVLITVFNSLLNSEKPLKTADARIAGRSTGLKPRC
jgi:hypothetical protein